MSKTILVKIIISSFLTIFLFLNGCANTGPPLSKNELEKLEEEIEVLATEIYIKDFVRVWKVGLEVLSILPKEAFKTRAVIGALIVNNSEDIAKFYKLPTEEGCVVIGVIDNYIADLAGIRQGDIIKEIEGNKIKDISQITFNLDKSTTVIVERDSKKLSFVCKIGRDTIRTHRP